jgi:GrpB-like predicted nucleotidyltransferase (UPF0157 family)
MISVFKHFSKPELILSPYQEAWPLAFKAAFQELSSVFVDANTQIEHIGSTSVLDLSAKPVIDILLGAASLLDIEAKITALERQGYQYVPKYETEIPQRRYFVKAAQTKESTSPFRLHVHGVVIGSELWQEYLFFRDQLRANPTLREEYQTLKLRLANEFAHDKSAYTEAKAPFIRKVLTHMPASHPLANRET